MATRGSVAAAAADLLLLHVDGVLVLADDHEATAVEGAGGVDVWKKSRSFLFLVCVFCGW